MKMSAAEEKELLEFLDNALEDFDIKKTGPEKKLEDVWADNFEDETAEEAEKRLKTLLTGCDGEKSELSDCLGTITNNIITMMKQETGAATNVKQSFDSVIEKALTDLSETSESLSNDVDFLEKLANTSLEDKVDASLGLMQGMLQGLLSKEMLYPSLNELVSDKYPKWLEENKDSLPAAELENYNKQLTFIQKICDELEKEKDDDSEEVKKKRFDSIVTLMQEAHSCGQLPEDLVGEQAMPFEFDSEGEPVIPSMLRDMESPQSCSIM